MCSNDVRFKALAIYGIYVTVSYRRYVICIDICVPVTYIL